MDERFSDELVSAYLDGELSAHEQAQADELLMDSVEHRKMFDELRALRESLQSLPRYTLYEGFADRVLHQAEQTMLSTEAGEPTTKPTTSDKVQLAVKPPAISDRGVLRGIGWSIAAIAAAIAIAMFFGPGLNETVPVADGPNDKVADSARAGQKTEDTGKLQQESVESLPDDSAPSQDRLVEKSLDAVEGHVRISKGGQDRSLEEDATAKGKVVAREALKGEEFDRKRVALRAISHPTDTLYVFVEVPADVFEKRAIDLALKKNGVQQFIPQNFAEKEQAMKMADNVASTAVRFSQAVRIGEKVRDEEGAKDVEAADFDILIVETTAERADAMVDDLRSLYSGIKLAKRSVLEREINKTLGATAGRSMHGQADAPGGYKEELADREDDQTKNDVAPDVARLKLDQGNRTAGVDPTGKNSPADFRDVADGFGAAIGARNRTADDDKNENRDLEFKQTRPPVDAVTLAYSRPGEFFYRLPVPSVASEALEQLSRFNQREHRRARSALPEDPNATKTLVAEAEAAPARPSEAKEVEKSAVGRRGGVAPIDSVSGTSPSFQIVLVIRAVRSPAIAVEADPLASPTATRNVKESNTPAPADSDK